MKLGIGYLFGAKDDGLLKLIKQVRLGFTGVADDARKSDEVLKKPKSKDGLDAISIAAEGAKAALQGVNTVFHAMTQFQLGDIRSSLDELTSGLDGATSGGMSGKIEGMFIEFDKGFRAAAIQTGVLGKDLKKLEGQVFATAYGMNRGAEEVGNNVLALKHAGLTFEQILGKGSTMTDFQKVVEATGLAAGDYAASFQALSKSWNLGEAGARGFFDAYAKQATALGIGHEAFESLPSMLESMNKEWAVTLQEMGPDAVKSALLGTSKLGAMLQKITGDDPKKSMSTASDLFAAVSQSGAAFTKLMTGLGGELTPFTQELAFLGVGAGGVQGALDELGKGAKDPAKFMADLSRIVAQLDARGGDAAATMKTRLLASLAEINPSLGFLVQKGDLVGKVLSEMDAKSRTAGIGMKEMGKQAYASGLTLDDMLERARDGLEATFGRVFAPERKKIVAAIVGAYKSIGSALKALTGDSEKSDKTWVGLMGHLGMSAETALKVKEVFASLREKLNDWFDKAGPVAAFGVAVKYIAGMMGGLLLAMAPLITVGLTIASVVGGLLVSALGAVASAITAGGLVIGLKIAAVAVAGLAYTAAHAVVVAGSLVAAGTFLYLLFSGKLPDAITTASKALQDMSVVVDTWASKQLQKLTGWLTNIDGAQLANDAEKFVTDLWDTLVKAFNSDVSLRDDTKSAGARLMEAVFAVGAQVYRIVGQFATRVWEIAKERFAAIDWKDVAKSVWGGIRAAFMATVATVGSLYDAALAWVKDVNWGNIGSELGAGMGEIREYVYDAVVKLFGDASTYLAKQDWAKIGSDAVMSLFGGFADFGRYDAAGKNIATGLEGSANEALENPGLIVSIRDGIATLFGKAVRATLTKEFWHQIFDVSLRAAVLMLTAAGALATMIRSAFATLGEMAVDSMFGVGTWAHPMDRMVAEVHYRIQQLKDAFKSLWADIRTGAFDLFGNSINTFVHHDFGVIFGIIESAKGWFASLSDVASSMFDIILSKLTFFLKKFMPIGELFSSMADKFGLSAPDVKTLVEVTKADSSKPVQSLVERAGDSLLIATIVAQHSEDRKVLNDILAKIGGGADASPSMSRKQREPASAARK